MGELMRTTQPARLLMPTGERRYLEMPAGGTVADLLDQVPTDLLPMVRVFNHGTVVADWETFHLREGDNILIAVVPQGGGGGGNKKGIIGAILTIVVAVVAWYVAPMLVAAYGGTAGIWAAGITMVGSMVIGALVAPPSVSTGAALSGGVSANKSYALQGQSNQPHPYGACMVIYGRHKVMPLIASNPNVDNWAQTSTLTALYDFGLGYVNLYDLRIGDVPIWQYQPQVVLHQNSYCNELRLNTVRLGYDQYAFNLQRNVPVTVRTKINTISADLDLQFPKGIFQATTNGQIGFWADFVAYWRPASGADWQEVPVDWYYGAASRGYTAGGHGIQFNLPPLTDWHEYAPGGVGTAKMREVAAAWWTLQQMFQGNPNPNGGGDAEYIKSTANPWIGFSYPSGAIDEGSYFGRYPEIRQAGWTGSAQAHFEAIGSRERRDPGVPVYVTLVGVGSAILYTPDGALPTMMHNEDMGRAPDNRYVGGWGWIESGGRLSGAASTTQVMQSMTWNWRITEPGAFDGGTYLARYPDVAAAGMDPWTHFTRNGAFEARDPYVTPASQRSVRLGACWVGPYWMRINFQFPTPGEYDLQVMRTDKIEDGTDSSIIQASGNTISARYNESTVALLRSYEWGLVVQPRKRHTMLEMKVTATDQLQGVVQNLSAVAVGVVPVTNDGANFWYAETRNNAWIVLDLLMSEKNPKPKAASEIDWPSWFRLAAACDSLRSYVVNGYPYTGPRYTCDIVVTDFGTVKELCESILSACRASLILTSAGKTGVLYDEEKTVPRQVFTPANSWGFNGGRNFVPQPHALRVNFINSDNAWSKDEVIVYWDGYNAANATEFETLDTYGITDYPHAWAYGRFMMAQGIQRSELFTLTLDVENLLVQRGDMVYAAHDVPKVGGVPARIVRSVPGGGIMVDQELSIAPTGYAVRMQDGTVRTGAIGWNDSVPAGWLVMDNNTGVEPDDLIVLGDYGRVTQPYLVQRITPGADLTAEVTLCKYVPGVYNADQGALPPWDPGFGHDYINGTDLTSFELVATQTMYYIEREPKVDVQLRWKTSGYALDHHEVTAIMPSGERVGLDMTCGPTNFKWTLDALREQRFFGVAIQFEIVPMNTSGFRGTPAYGSILLLLDRTAPHAVLQFGANVQKENVDLFWQPDQDPDIAYYMLRYTPQAEQPNWDSSQILAVMPWPATKTSAGARTGSYGIRVVDTSGNQGPVVWRRTTVAVLPEINVITILNDRDLYPIRWPGKKSHVHAAGLEVMQDGEFGAIYPDGIYYCSYPVDLGDVYEVRVSSKIEAYGVTAADYMSNWALLSELDAMASASSDLWDAWVEVRTADEMAVMADWTSMSVTDPIAGAEDSDWSAWRPVHVGDFTARLLQFRIVLKSYNSGVRVVVNSGRIEVDMPDRIDTYGDVPVPAVGLDFFFPVSFRHLESVAITIDGNADPVVAVVTNKTPEGFHLVLKNTTNGAATAGQVDIMAEGYGRKRLTSI